MGKKIQQRLAAHSRWVHLYLSVGSFTIILFFAVTGFTLNHAEWFEQNPRLTKLTGMISPLWIPLGDTNHIKKQEIIEYLQGKGNLVGHLRDFRADETSISIAFAGPAYSADVRIDRKTGHYTALETRFGLISKMNDLHKGRDTGSNWHLVIDLAAVFISLISISGILMLFFMGKKRLGGLVFIFIGSVLFYVFYLLS